MSYLKDILFYNGIAMYSDIEYRNGKIVDVNPHCVSSLSSVCVREMLLINEILVVGV